MPQFLLFLQVVVTEWNVSICFYKRCKLIRNQQVSGSNPLIGYTNIFMEISYLYLISLFCLPLSYRFFRYFQAFLLMRPKLDTSGQYSGVFGQSVFRYRAISYWRGNTN